MAAVCRKGGEAALLGSSHAGVKSARSWCWGGSRASALMLETAPKLIGVQSHDVCSYSSTAYI